MKGFCFAIFIVNLCIPKKSQMTCTFSCNDCTRISPFLWSSNTGFEVFVIFERIKEPFGFSALSFFKGLHFLEKYKFESTIGQQMKLIDYLQALYEDNNSNKKKKVDSLSPPQICLPAAVPPPGRPTLGPVGEAWGCLVADLLRMLHLLSFLYLHMQL